MPVVPPRGEEIYREEISVTPVKTLVVFETVFGIFFLLSAFVPLFSGALVSDAPSVFFRLLLAVVFFSTGWFVYNFNTYRITVGPEGLILAFGRLRTVVLFEDMDSYSQDTNSSLLYGGWGYRITMTKDGWGKSYTLFRKNRIDLKLKTGRYRHIIFSTDNPDAVTQILRERLKNAPGHVRSAF